MKLVDSSWPLWSDATTVDDGGPVWVAADETGSSGEDLSNASQTVFAHASVRIDDETAAPILDDLREQTRSLQGSEAKFKNFNGPRGWKALNSALGPGGMLHGRVFIGIADKKYLTVSKMIDLLIEELAHDEGVNLYANRQARKLAVAFFVEGPRALGDMWEPLMNSFVSLARATQRASGEKETVDSFFERLEKARWHCHRRSVEQLLHTLRRTRTYAEELVRGTQQRRSAVFPGLDPIVTMLPMTLNNAYVNHGAVRFLHDDQNVLTPEFLRDMLPALWHGHPDLVGMPQRTRVAEFWKGDSKKHPSIQLADIVASAGRVVAESLLGKSSKAGDALCPVVRPLIREWVAADLPTS